jgi:hypothetical protein
MMAENTMIREKIVSFELACKLKTNDGELHALTSIESRSLTVQRTFKKPVYKLTHNTAWGPYRIRQICTLDPNNENIILR